MFDWTGKQSDMDDSKYLNGVLEVEICWSGNGSKGVQIQKDHLPVNA